MVWLSVVDDGTEEVAVTEASDVLFHASNLTELRLDLWGPNDYQPSVLWVRELLLAYNFTSRFPRSAPLTLILPEMQPGALEGAARLWQELIGRVGEGAAHVVAADNSRRDLLTL